MIQASEFELVREQVGLAHLVGSLRHAGLAVNPEDVVDFYVGLKTKPLVILAGPHGSGKIKFVEHMANFLLGGRSSRFQQMLGHPWWAGETDNVVLFTTAQNRFISEKLLCLLEEASLPENSGRLFIGCLTRISPGELAGIFSSLSTQIANGVTKSYNASTFRLPQPWPSNLFLLGTIDTEIFDWWESDLLVKTNIFSWQPANPPGLPAHQPELIPIPLEDTFLASMVREKSEAYRKLHDILNRPAVQLPVQPLHLLLVLTEILDAYQIPGAHQAMHAAIMYVANAWTKDGVGLFDEHDSRNMDRALDRAILHNLLPLCAQAARRSRGLRRDLHLVLRGRYPRSYAQLLQFSSLT